MNEMLNPNDIVSATFWLMSLAMAGATAFFFFEQRRVADRFKLCLAVMGAVTLISGHPLLPSSRGLGVNGIGVDGLTDSSTGSSPPPCSVFSSASCSEASPPCPRPSSGAC